MIIHPLDPATDGEPALWLVVNQIDHAAFAAEVLSLWRADGLPEHPRRRALLRGTREHDNGWAEADSAPRVRDDGTPHDFRSMPMDLRLDIFQRGARRKLDADPEAWVYVVRHALYLHRDDAGVDDDWQHALHDWRTIEEDLRERIELSEDDLAADYRHLWTADALSLAACLRWTEPRTVHGTKMWVSGGEGDMGDKGDKMAVTLHLDPLPLAGSTTFKIRSRRIPRRTYTGDADLAMELATARWEDLTVRVAG